MRPGSRSWQGGQRGELVMGRRGGRVSADPELGAQPRPLNVGSGGRRVQGRLFSRSNVRAHPPARVEALRRVLRDEPLVRADELFTIETSLRHGHVEAIVGMVRRLGLDTVLATKRSRARDLVLAMIVERLVHPCSKSRSVRASRQLRESAD
jgi:hypothetical protein